MADPKYTKGPWRCVLNKSGTSFLILANGRMLVCDMSWHANVRADYPLRAESEANARLIAAAPELLEALRDVTAKLSACRFIVSDQNARNEMTDSVEAAVSIIGKATKGLAMGSGTGEGASHG